MEKVEIDLGAIAHNLSILGEYCSSCMPIVKADAYGHGLIETAQACLRSSGSKKVHGFGVGSIEEGVLLRKAGINLPIYSLLGLQPHDLEKGHLAKSAQIIVCAHNKNTLEQSAYYGYSISLKFDTGMHRLGFCEADISYIIDFLENNPQVKLELIFSHLAMADSVDKIAIEYTQEQGQIFERIVKRFKEKYPYIQSSLGQSAGALQHNFIMGDIPRFGLALYGSNPFYKTEKEYLGKGLKPVMSVSAPVIAVRVLKKGDKLGYGQIYTATEEQKIAILAIGYADMYRRMCIDEKSKNTVEAVYKEKRVPLIGKVCMQMSFFDITGTTCKEGDFIYLLGGNSSCKVSPDELALAWNTIPYEVICLFGKSQQRTYLEG